MTAWKQITLKLISLAVLIAGVLLLSPGTASASTYSDADSLKKTVMYDYANMIYGCYLQNDGVETDRNKVRAGQLFYHGAAVSYVGAVSYNPTINRSVSDLGDDKFTFCGQNDGALSKAALSAWGISAIDLVCEMGYKREGQGTDCKQSNDRNFQSWGGINSANARANAFKSAIQKLTGLNMDQPGADVQYLYWKDYVVFGCTTGTGVAPNQTSVSGDMRYELRSIGSTGETTTVYSGGKRTGEYPVANSRDVPNNVTCGTALSRANNAFPGYFQIAQEISARQQCQNQGYRNVPGGSVPGQNDLNACTQGVINKNSDGFCTSTYPDYNFQGAQISRASERSACEWGQGQVLSLETIAARDNSNAEAAGENPTSCVIEGVGWIVCTFTNFLASVVDGIYENLIAPMLRTQPINVDTTSGQNGIFNAWSFMRTVANALFIIAFLIIIFSQLTGAGVSNYGVKKTLPRLLIAAILVNLSFYISAIAVDISNILGTSIYSVLTSVKDNMNIAPPGGWVSLMTILLSGGTAAAAAGTVATGGALAALAAILAGGSLIPGLLLGLIGLALIMLVSAVIAVFIVVFLLVARQVLVIIFIVISPLAFVALLLPNTEKLFTKWRQWFISLLLLFPVVSLFFAMAQIIALVMISNASISSANLPDIVYASIMLMSANLVMVLPFFFLPMLLKKYSGGNLDKIAGNLKTKAQSLAKPVTSVGRFGQKTGMGMMKRNVGLGYKRAKALKAQGKSPNAISSVVGSTGNMYDGYMGKKKLQGETYDEAMQDAQLERLTNPAYALQAAGGDQAKATQLIARAEAAKDAREMKDAEAIQSTLSLTRSEQFELAETGQLTTKSGQILSGQHHRRAALATVGPSLNLDEAMRIAQSVDPSRPGNENLPQGVRTAASQAVAKSGAGSQAPWLGGARLGKIENGDYNADDAIAEAMPKLKARGITNGGKDVVAQAVAAADRFGAKSRDTSLDLAKRQEAAQKENDIRESLSRAVREVYASPDIRPDVTRELETELNLRGLIPEQFKPQPTQGGGIQIDHSNQNPPNNTPPTTP